MAEQETSVNEKAEKKKLAEEKKKLKAEQKEQKKLAKERAKEIATQEEELSGDDGAGVATVFVTALIVVIWLAILVILVKLDVGGFGSNVLAPVLQNVPVVNKILPNTTETMMPSSDNAEEEYNGYSNMKDAMDQIRSLEMQLEQEQTSRASYSDELDVLKAEIERLKTFEKNQVEFQKIKTEFYEEVVYSEKGPGAEIYKEYYESIDPATAEYLYKQVVQQLEESKEITDYAKAYSAMKPKQAAAIFEAMEDNLDLAARILLEMDSADRGNILGAMKAEIAAKLTKIMEPE